MYSLKKLSSPLGVIDRKTILSIVLTASLLVTCSSASPPIMEEEKVVETMRSLIVAVANDDENQFHTITSPDFYAFDGGRKITGDELMTLIKDAHAAGKVYTWQVTEPQVHVEGQMAWITYFNRGSLQDASGKKDFVWLESAVLHKSAGAWRIQFVHSTRASPQ